MNNEYGFGDLEKLINEMYAKHGLFSTCDLVYNHMSNDSEFLRRHPDSAYNMLNSPHLRPALIIDRVLYYVTRDICRGLYENQGVYADRVEHYYMDSLRRIIRDQELPKHKITQFYEIDEHAVMNEIKRIGLEELEKIVKNIG